MNTINYTNAKEWLDTYRKCAETASDLSKRLDDMLKKIERHEAAYNA